MNLKETTSSSSIRAQGVASVSCSAVVACYNYGRFLPRALAALQQQSLQLKEIVIVDDGSTDEHTLEVLAACGEEPQVRILRLP